MHSIESAINFFGKDRHWKGGPILFREGENQFERKEMKETMKRKTVRSFIAVALALQMVAAGATPVFAAQAAQVVPAANHAVTAVMEDEEGDIALYLRKVFAHMLLPKSSMTFPTRAPNRSKRT